MQRNPIVVPNHTPNPDKRHRNWSGCWKDQSERKHQYHPVVWVAGRRQRRRVVWVAA